MSYEKMFPTEKKLRELLATTPLVITYVWRSVDGFWTLHISSYSCTVLFVSFIIWLLSGWTRKSRMTSPAASLLLFCITHSENLTLWSPYPTATVSNHPAGPDLQHSQHKSLHQPISASVRVSDKPSGLICQSDSQTHPRPRQTNSIPTLTNYALTTTAVPKQRKTA